MKECAQRNSHILAARSKQSNLYCGNLGNRLCDKKVHLDSGIEGNEYPLEGGDLFRNCLEWSEDPGRGVRGHYWHPLGYSTRRF